MTLLDVRNLTVVFHSDQGTVNAVDGVDFSVPKGGTVGLVGESGCGKTVTALTVMQLLAPTAEVTSGNVLFNGVDLLKKTPNEMCNIRGNDISMIFQEPMTSLNPVLTVGFQLTEAITTHSKVSKEEARKRALDMLSYVGITDVRSRIIAYPHQLSGGIRQRVMIAMALACNPALLIADEPTTALDVTIQAQILQLMRRIQVQNNMSVIMITHDLGVIAETSDEVYVMYAGQIIERAGVFDLFKSPHHPYTVGLLRSRPYIAGQQKVHRLTAIPGTVPNMLRIPPGCRFAPRCPEATDICRRTPPPAIQVGDGHVVRCHKYDRALAVGGASNVS